MRKTIAIILLLTLSWTTSATEQQTEVEQKLWTLDQCMHYAVENSPRTNRQKFQNEIYRQQYKAAIGNLLPSLSASTSASFNFGRGLDAVTNTYIDINSFSNNYNIYASLTLFDGLANYNRVRMGKMNRLLGKQEMEQEQDMVAYETMEAFMQVLYNTDLVAIAKEQLAESAQNLKQVRRMEELGVKGYPDVVEIEAKEAEDAYNLTRQENLLTISVIMLKEKMNYPIDEPLTISDTDYEQEQIAKIIESAETIYNYSKGNNPKALAAESSYESKVLQRKVTRGQLMPTISVEAGLNTNFSRYMDGSAYESFSQQFKNRRGEYIGFSLSIPIFSGFSRSSNLQQAKAQEHIARINRDETLQILYSEIEQAVADANGQVDEYHQATKSRQAARVAYDVNRRKYEEGLIDPIILHTSANRLLRAKAEELNAKYMYHLKYKLVKYYGGEPLFVKNKEGK